MNTDPKSVTTFANDILHSTRLRVINCCTCGVTFGLTAEFMKARVDDMRWFYCPNGHDQHYSESEAARLRKDLAAKQQRLDGALAREVALRDQKEATERSLVATKGHVTRAKKRAAAGVCQWCNRSFANVAAHVAGQHPEHKP